MIKLLREITSDITRLVIVDAAVFNDLKYLTESAEAMEKHKQKNKKLKHLTHLEDMILVGGQEGFDSVLSTLGKTHDYLQGKRRDGFSLATKFDGSPSIIWGYDPEGKFFVGTKSFFNKTPKINHDNKEIDANHSKSPRLAEKLKFLLPLLKKVSPKQGIFQGDLMYSADEVQKSSNTNLSFTPNTLTYNVDKNSYEGQQVMKSKVGIAAHTHYEQQPNGELRAVFDVDMSKFTPSDDIHFLPTKLRGPFEYKPAAISKFADALSSAQKMNQKLQKSGAFEAIKGHETLLMSYVNNVIKNKKAPSPEGYVAFIYGQLKKKTEHLKLDKTKVKWKGVLDTEVKNVMDNKQAFSDIFKAHRYIQDAKNVLVDVLSKNSSYNETILGDKSKPEGFVASINGQPTKLVDREHFSAANLDFNSKVDPSENPLVLSFGRMNPPTVGHGKLIAKGADIARRIGAKQSVVASRSQDPKKNPLSPTQKISWLKSMFPGTNTSIAAPDAPTLVAQLQHAYNQGVRDLTMVVGADRVAQFQHVLSHYNGEGPGKLFNFHRARIVSAGERDPDSEDATESMSASKMREAAKKGDFKTFQLGVPPHIKPPQAQEMFHTLRAEMGGVKIDQSTPGHVLSIYAKREANDKIGMASKQEIERRKARGLWKGA
jgi:hypothetical protein